MAYPTVQSVTKALKILELLIERSAENKALTLADIHRECDILPVTARNLLRTLEECGYAKRRSHGQYEEGERCYSVLRTGGIIRKLREISAPVVKDTSEDLGESLVVVSILNGHRIEIIRHQAKDDRAKSPDATDNTRPYQMRTTRAILAWFHSEPLNDFIEHSGLPSIEDWPECSGSLNGLKQELSNIRRRGGCNDQRSSFAAIAVPILTSNNEVIASIGCYAPLERTDLARATGIFKLMQNCAQQIRELLPSDPINAE
tara:strand:+ start:9470 stop:10249 length:780 start_codon:yes stop_codon:yes gene_type:complete